MPRPVVAPNMHMVDDAHDQQVWLWDTGPRKPVMPKKPDAPKQAGMEEGEYALAMIEFEVIAEEWQRALKQYGVDRKEYENWTKRNGGPVEFSQYSVDARDTLERDANRYYVSARTRGHEHKANFGLPPGVKPGHGQAENERRRQENDELLDEVRRQDPVFGDPSLRAG